MLPLIEFPQIVQHYPPWFASVFSAEGLVQFRWYLSGLIISENKTVDGISRLFVFKSRHQSSLNRLLTASPFSEMAPNQQRLALLDSLEGTRVKPKGVLSVIGVAGSRHPPAGEQIGPQRQRPQAEQVADR